jgi:hypothetical protein
LVRLGRLVSARTARRERVRDLCHFVHFFASPEDRARWTAEHPGTFLLSVEGAYRLGELTNRAAFGAALVTGGR